MYDYNYYDYGYDYGSTVGGILGGLMIFFVIMSIIALGVAVVQLIAQWKLYQKAGKGGWEAIVPFYSNYVLVEIAGLNWYWFLGFFAPFVLGLIPGIGFIGWLAYLFTLFNIFFNLSKKFNKGIGFAICGTLFTPIIIAILGFSKKEIYNNIPVSPHGVFESANNNQNAAYQAYQQPMQQPVQPTYQQSVAPTMQPQPVMPVVEPVVPVQPIVSELEQAQVVTPIVPGVAPVEQPTYQQSVEQSKPAFCTNCGSALMPNASFCTNCGKQL